MNHLAIYSTKAFGEDYSAMDIIYLKESSGPVRGRIKVESVVDAEVKDPEEIMQFLAPRYKELGIKDEDHLLPVRVFKRDMRNWVSDYEVPEELFVAFL
jgi:hypothetical protein